MGFTIALSVSCTQAAACCYLLHLTQSARQTLLFFGGPDYMKGICQLFIVLVPNSTAEMMSLA